MTKNNTSVEQLRKILDKHGEFNGHSDCMEFYVSLERDHYKDAIEELAKYVTHLQEQTRREIAKQLNLTVLMHEQELAGKPKIIESLESKIRAYIRYELTMCPNCQATFPKHQQIGPGWWMCSSCKTESEE